MASSIASGQKSYGLAFSNFSVHIGFFYNLFAFFDLGLGQVFKNFNDSGFVHCPDLVDRDHSFLSIVLDRNPCRIFFQISCHWGKDNCFQIFVHFIWRNDHARSCLFYFTPYGRVKVNKNNRVLF